MMPETIEIDGHKLAVPVDHPAFYKAGIPAVWKYLFCGSVGRKIELLDDRERSACVSEAFTYWMLKALDYLGPGHMATDLFDDEDYRRAMAWAKWGGLV